MANGFLHIVIAKFYDHVPEEAQQEILGRMAALGNACGGREAGILAWEVSWNLDQRKGYHLMEMGVFADTDAFQRFRAHPIHAKFATDLSRIGDWIVGDMFLNRSMILTNDQVC